MDPTSILKLAGNARRLHEILTYSGRRLDLEEMHGEWLQDLAIRLRELVSDADVLEARLSRLEQDSTRSHVVRNYHFEAVREAIEDRRRLLRDAAASTIIDDDEEVRDLARVERLLRHLDSDDIDSLLSLASRSFKGDGDMQKAIEQEPFGGSALIASGCLLVDGPGSLTVSDDVSNITPLGHLVIRVLAQARARSVP